MSLSQPVIFLDLHGVLVETPRVFDEYKRLTIHHLVNHFGLDPSQAYLRYDKAMSLWEKEAFSYLRNPTKKKVDGEFLSFLESCDKLFPKYLYEGLEIDQDCDDIRTRPFEYKIARNVKALYPEVKATLEHLSDHGYKMYVASSSHSSHIQGIIEVNNLEDYISGFFGFDTLASTKHTMIYYRRLADAVGVEPKRCVMVGNSMHEVLKPRKLGMITIHINRERKVPLNIRKMADKSLTDLKPLPIHLDRIPLSV